MPNIDKNYNSGGEALQPNQGNPDDLKSALQSAVDDLAALRAAVVSITAQLDADAGVTDTDYAANNDPVANTLTKTT